MRLTAGGILCIALACASADANAEPYHLTILPGLGGTSDVAFSINNAGAVVGVSNDIGNVATRATQWSGSSPLDLGPASASYSYAYAVNAVGQSAGYSAFPLAGGGLRFSATKWVGSVATELQGFANSSSFAYGINDLGVIAGLTEYQGQTKATIWSNGLPSVLDGLGGSAGALSINNHGLLVGWSYVGPAGAYVATSWTGGLATELTHLAGATGNSNANDVNDLGQIVGSAQLLVGGSELRAALWENGAAYDLGSLGGKLSAATSINESGVIAGYSQSIDGIVNATMWRGAGPIDLNSLLEVDVLKEGWHLDTAQGINDLGWIVGTASNQRMGVYSAAFMLVPAYSEQVPEPQTLLLVFLGLFGVAAIRLTSIQPR